MRKEVERVIEIGLAATITGLLLNKAARGVKGVRKAIRMAEAKEEISDRRFRAREDRAYLTNKAMIERAVARQRGRF